MAQMQSEVHVGQLLADAINAFLSAAALHLGMGSQAGETVEGNPTEAWLAIMGASALVSELSPHMAEPMRKYFGKALDEVLQAFAARYPDEVVPLPGLLPDPA